MQSSTLTKSVSCGRSIRSYLPRNSRVISTTLARPGRCREQVDLWRSVVLKIGDPVTQMRTSHLLQYRGIQCNGAPERMSRIAITPTYTRTASLRGWRTTGHHQRSRTRAVTSPPRSVTIAMGSQGNAGDSDNYHTCAASPPETTDRPRCNCIIARQNLITLEDRNLQPPTSR